MFLSFFQTIFIISLTTGTIILALLLLSSFIHKNYVVKWYYFAWLFLALRLVLPFHPTLPQTPMQLTIPQTSFIYSSQLEASPIAVYENGENSLLNPITTNNEVTTHSGKSISIMQIATLVYFMGLVISFSYYCLGYFIFCRRVKLRGKAISSINILESLSSLQETMPIDHPLCIKSYDQISSPMMFGFFTPTILLPHENYTDFEISFILKHELIHFKHKDLWYKLLLTLATILHWFNPLVYVLKIQAGKSIEMVCDTVAVKNTDVNFRKEYSQAILNAISYQKNPPFTTQFNGSKKTMKQRFGSIFDLKNKKKGVLTFCFVMIMALGLSACISTVSDTNTIEEETTSQKLFNLKANYIGNASNFGNLTSLLEYGAYRNGFELQTTTRPYGATMHYVFTQKELDDNSLIVDDTLILHQGYVKNAAIIFALVENVDILTFSTTVPSVSRTAIMETAYNRSDFTKVFGKDPFIYSENIITFAEEFFPYLCSQDGATFYDAVMKSSASK